jgi:hypothetical protein
VSIDTEIQRAHLVRTFVHDGVLTGLPAKFEKRRLVMEHVADHFEPGRRYTEQEVDGVLLGLTEAGGTDHVTVRRYLVDYCLLSREDGVYWRTGGWVAGS